MDEARRFLRYVIPSLSFVVQTISLLLVLFPNLRTTKFIAGLCTENGIGFAIAALLLGSGGLGFVFSIFHHCLFGLNCKRRWCRWLAGPVDYRDLIERLRNRNFLCLFDTQCGNILPSMRKPNRREAWAIVTSLWHERIETNKKIKSANLRADSLADLMHGIGTARVATVIAVVLAFAIFCLVKPSFGTWDLVSAGVIAITLFVSHQIGYMRAGFVQLRFVEQVLTDALADEVRHYRNPVITHVVLDDKKQRGTT